MNKQNKVDLSFTSSPSLLSIDKNHLNDDQTSKINTTNPHTYTELTQSTSIIADPSHKLTFRETYTVDERHHIAKDYLNARDINPHLSMSHFSKFKHMLPITVTCQINKFKKMIIKQYTENEVQDDEEFAISNGISRKALIGILTEYERKKTLLNRSSTQEYSVATNRSYTPKEKEQNCKEFIQEKNKNPKLTLKEFSVKKDIHYTRFSSYLNQYRNEEFNKFMKNPDQDKEQFSRSIAMPYQTFIRAFNKNQSFSEPLKWFTDIALIDSDIKKRSRYTNEEKDEICLAFLKMENITQKKYEETIKIPHSTFVMMLQKYKKRIFYLFMQNENQDKTQFALSNGMSEKILLAIIKSINDYQIKPTHPKKEQNIKKG